MHAFLSPIFLTRMKAASMLLLRFMIFGIFTRFAQRTCDEEGHSPRISTIPAKDPTPSTRSPSCFSCLSATRCLYPFYGRVDSNYSTSGCAEILCEYLERWFIHCDSAPNFQIGVRFSYYYKK